jgi:hypothetical protein
MMGNMVWWQQSGAISQPWPRCPDGRSQISQPPLPLCPSHQLPPIVRSATPAQIIILNPQAKTERAQLFFIKLCHNLVMQLLAAFLVRYIHRLSSMHLFNYSHESKLHALLL